MKIDKKTLDMLSSLPDDSLWKMICTLASASGIDLSDVKATHGDLELLRSAMGQMTDGDISRAVDILNSVKQKNS